MVSHLFEHLFNSNFQGIFAFDQEYHYIAWNQAMERFFSLSQAEVLGKFAFDLFPALQESGEDRCYAAALAGQTVVAKDRPYITPETGAPSFFEACYSPLIDETGEIIGGMAVLRDITECKQRKAEITQRNRQLLTLQYAAAAITASLDLQQVLETVTREMVNLLDMTGCTVYTWDQATDTISSMSHYEHGGCWLKKTGQQIRSLADFPVTKRVLQERRAHQMTLSQPDLEPAELAYMQEHQLKTLLILPVEFQDHILGLVELMDDQIEYTFTYEEVGLVQMLANQAAIAIENAQLYEQAQQDIARRKQAEARLADERNLLRTLIDNLPDYIYIKDSESRFINGNLAVSRLMGAASPEALIGQTDFAYYPTKLAARYYADDQAVIETGQSLVNQEEPVQSSDGHQGWILTTKIPLQDNQGHIVGLVGIGRDITELKQVELELATYRDRLEVLVEERTTELEQALTEIAHARDNIDAILRAVADGLIVTDLDHRVILANPAATELLDLTLEEMVGREITASIKDPGLMKLVRQTVDQRSNGHEIELKIKDETAEQYRVIRARSALVSDQQGQPWGIVTIIQDMTQLREVDRLKTQLLTTAAHELRTPLTSILGFSELLLSRNLDQGRQQRYLTMINQQATHLARIIEDLLDVSRLQTGRSLALEIEPVNLAQFFKTVMLPFVEATSKHEIRIEGVAKLPTVQADPFRLAQVARNLLSNAIKYSPQGGVITVRGQLKSDHLEITVQDEGLGMTQEQQQHLFQPFYRADHSHTAIGGTGLGLVISQLIIEQHGGEIWVESDWGQGTTVHFTLPVDKP